MADKLRPRFEGVDMIKVFAVLGLALTAFAQPRAAEVPIGKAPPEFKADKWYNTAPISLEDLKGKTVLLQVFRTW
jgi:hypothetical protein